MNNETFRKDAHALVDWMADYFNQVETYPVKSQVQPGEIFKQLPTCMNDAPDDFANIFNDFKNIIMPGITHWQHPNFFAYYPANTSGASILGEMLMATLGVQCMSWQTSPAATELEECVIKWLIDLLGLPPHFDGVIQDSASTASLCSILTARERASALVTNEFGLYQQKPFTLYCSTEAHSSIEKAVKIAGLGHYYLRKIPVDNAFAMCTDALSQQIEADVAAGFTPLWVVAALGTTGSTAMDPLAAIVAIAQRYGVWVHVDAAYAGTAFMLPEVRHYYQGIDAVDSFVFNPHKWMFTNFDCSVYFVKDKQALISCFEILPEYLKTKETSVNNYRDWSTSLGRRFRALKLWWVLRSFGKQQLQMMIRKHIQLAKDLYQEIQAEPDFKILAPLTLNNICFRYQPVGMDDITLLNQINAELLESLNNTGKLYLTHTKLNNQYVLRLVIGQTHVEAHHIAAAWALIKTQARATCFPQVASL